LKRMVTSVSRMLRRIDDLRSAARAARRLAEHLDPEEKQGVLLLADDWEMQADKDEEEVVRYSAEAEAS
jgi:hypothetical protein